ncbi:hypothetical protein K440DRAFT_643276 [Wilcoxina mikolae CBS 423.85]|nr:hypothetical protein K440DRAFT_643276 [Wilcoxina mikolae CBS 423.85]
MNIDYRKQASVVRKDETVAERTDSRPEQSYDSSNLGNPLFKFEQFTIQLLWHIDNNFIFPAFLLARNAGKRTCVAKRAKRALGTAHQRNGELVSVGADATGAEINNMSFVTLVNGCGRAAGRNSMSHVAHVNRGESLFASYFVHANGQDLNGLVVILTWTSGALRRWIEQIFAAKARYLDEKAGPLADDTLVESPLGVTMRTRYAF